MGEEKKKKDQTKTHNTKIQIDQSGKIEDTSKDTILCLSNGEWDAIIIKAATKRSLQEIFRRHGQIRNFILFSFSTGIACLLERNKKLLEVFIDEEYPGKNSVIKKVVLEILPENTTEIYFERIGKKALAHNRAYAIGLSKLEAKKTLSLEEIFKKIKMTEVGKRLKNA